MFEAAHGNSHSNVEAAAANSNSSSNSNRIGSTPGCNRSKPPYMLKSGFSRSPARMAANTGQRHATAAAAKMTT